MNRFLDHEAQREVLDYVKANIEKKEHLGWVDGRATGIGLLLRNEKLYSKHMKKLGISKADAGVTGHGLRAEYAEDMSLLMGLIPATRGGTKGQMDKEDQDLIRLRLSENLGHSRLAVTNAYIGSLTKKIQNSRGDRLGAVLLDGQKMAAIYMNPPPKLGLNGEYQRLSKRNIDGTDILVVIEDVSTGVSQEACEFSFKDSEQGIKSVLTSLTTLSVGDVEKDCADIRRIGGSLLAKFGVVI